jgi:selenocysteine-specific elongation factor
MTTQTNSVIVGTAGHIDHGKSALIEALTGTHPDRLAEEKRRGITIDLGFAFLEDAGVRFGFVDVPGHERFVSNMLAGATGIDVVLLVIAADEAVKPQTREHFDICRMLGVKSGVVALTKSDLVDADSAELVRMEVEDFLRGSFLERAAIVPVSAKTGAGIAELKQALHTASLLVSRRDAARYLRLPIDRSFAMKGFGTVVTGTLISGSVGTEDEVELFPGGMRLRVRGVQSGGRGVACATAGQRTAVNLAGIEHGAIRRGMVLATAGKFRATRRIDARLELLPGAPRLKQRSRVHFHAGTSATVAEIYFYPEHNEQDDVRNKAPHEVAGGMANKGATLAQLRLKDDVLVLAGDRFIVRQFSPVITIGGGVVLDPLARRPLPRDNGRTVFLETLERGKPDEIVTAFTERAFSGVTSSEIVARFGWSDAEVRDATQQAASSGRLKIVSEEPLVLVAMAVFEETRKKIATKVENFRKENPLQAGIAREALRAALGRRVRAETFRAALVELVAQKKVDAQGDIVKPAGSEVTLLPEEARAKEQIAKAFGAAGLAVPAVKEVLGSLAVEPQRAEKLLRILLQERQLVRVSPELIFHCEALRHLKEQLSTYRKGRGERISVPVFKELTGITRKYAIPLLEYLDREKVTRRAGDERVILQP